MIVVKILFAEVSGSFEIYEYNRKVVNETKKGAQLHVNDCIALRYPIFFNVFISFSRTAVILFQKGIYQAYNLITFIPERSSSMSRDLPSLFFICARFSDLAFVANRALIGIMRTWE